VAVAVQLLRPALFMASGALVRGAVAYACDLQSELSASGLRMGDLAYTADTDTWWEAGSAASWRQCTWPGVGGGGGSEAFPVGAVFIAVVGADPAQLLGYGSWQALGPGRALVGLDAEQLEFAALEQVGGEKAHALTAAEMPAHTHVQNPHSHAQRVNSASTGALRGYGVDTSTATPVNAGYITADATAVNQAAGGGQAHNNLQPYVVVRFWKRVA